MKRHVFDWLPQVRSLAQIWPLRVHWTTKPLSKFAEQFQCGDRHFDVGVLLLLLPRYAPI